MTIRNEDLIKIKNVPTLVYEIYGVKLNKDAIYKWTSVGRKSGDGTKKIKLKTTKRIGQLFTTEEWVRKFVKEIS